MDYQETENVSDFHNDVDEIAEESEDPSMNLGFTKELIDEIRETKHTNPEMFVSAWEEDTEGVADKVISDPVEKFLTSAEDGDVDLLKSLLDNNPDLVKKSDVDGYTALHRAAYNNHTAAVTFLLQNGADSEARTDDGWTPLLSASNWANYEVIGLLLSHGVDANAVSKGKVSALHLAINSQTEEPDHILHSVRYLLQAPGIDANVVSGSGDTPLMLARRSSKQLFELLESYLMTR